MVARCILVMAAFMSFVRPAGTAALYQLDDLEAVALGADPELESAYHTLGALIAEAEGIDLRYYPMLTLRYSHYPGFGSIEGDEIGTNHWFSARLRWDLLDWFQVKPEQEQVRRAGVEDQRIKIQMLEAKVLLECRTRYLDLLAQKTQRDSYAKQNALYGEILKILQERARLKRALPVDVLLVEKEIQVTQQYARMYREHFDKNRRLFAQILGLAEDDIDWERIAYTQEELPEAPLMETALERSLDRRRLDQQLRRVESQERASMYENVDIEPFAGYRYTESDYSGAQSGLEAGIQVNIPLSIFQRDGLRDRIVAAQRSAVAQQAEAVDIDLRKTVRDLYRSYEETGIHILDYDLELQILQEKIQIEQTIADLSGAAPGVNLEILQLQVKIEDTRMRRQLEEYDQWKDYFRLLNLAGAHDAYDIYAREAAREYPPLALWVWSQGDWFRAIESVPLFKRNCARRNVKQVFLSISQASLMEEAFRRWLPYLVKELHAAGIQVSALISEHSWIDPDKRPVLLQHVRNILDWQNAFSNRERLDGIHLDLEPQALPQWQENPQSLLSMLADTVAEVHRVIQSYPSAPRLECDVIPAYAEIDPGALKTIIRHASAVHIMAYGILNADLLFERTREAAAWVRKDPAKQVTIGLNAKDFKTYEKFVKMLWEVDKQYRTAETGPSVPVVSIHEYSSFLEIEGTR